MVITFVVRRGGVNCENHISSRYFYFYVLQFQYVSFIVCVCGNHDVGNRPTKDTIANYKSTFGDDYFSFWHNGVHFIVLNSQLYEDCSLTKDLAEAQDNWLGKPFKS